MSYFFDEKVNKEEVKIYCDTINNDLKNILNFINCTPTIEMRDNKTFKYIGRGAYGEVYSYKNYAIKLFYNSDEGVFGNTDMHILFKLQGMTSYPKLYAGCRFFMVTELIDGKELKDIYSEKDFSVINRNIVNILLQDIKNTLNMGIEPSDLHYENILISNNGILKIVDVGHFRTFRDTNNSNIEKRCSKKYILNNYLDRIGYYLNMIKKIIIKNKFMFFINLFKQKKVIIIRG